MNGHSTGRPREVHAITASPPHSSGRRTESYSPSLDYGDDDFGEEGDDFERHAPHRREERWGNGDQVPDHDEDLDENVRHGFAEAYSSDEYLKALEASYFLYFTDPRHAQSALPHSPTHYAPLIDWRNRDRIRTASAVLIVCLRIGYDPPDIIKTDPCAKLECWIDPYSLAKDKAMERIGKNLQTQFESLAATPKTRYKQILDPPIEDAKKACLNARKTAKAERVLFYYNGHGVPKPTSSGELWLFNKQYTQYIPVSLAEVITWLGSPSILVWDCSNAGNIVNKVQEFAHKRDEDLQRDLEEWELKHPPSSAYHHSSSTSTDPPAEAKPHIPNVPFRDTIQLGACLGHESLPMNPDLPADLFTCCLTSPIEIALRFFLLRNPLKTHLSLAMLLEIPGKLNDRRTPLGELTWIFTAVTDTIAWNTLPRPLFQKLFRHDLVIAALFRGFLLAERIMRFYDCTPTSVPALPQTHNHPLWDSWDLAVDMCVAQLPTLLRHIEVYRNSLPPEMPSASSSGDTAATANAGNLPPGMPPLPYIHSNFFAEQLTAFEIWLEQGAVEGRKTQPEQLPVVLQVLLSQAHRLKALVLLCKFLDLGPAAVNVALSIGIFAYVLRLLQAPAAELKPVLIYIWARILAVYESCKEDLLKSTYAPVARLTSTVPSNTGDGAPIAYFVAVLAPSPSHSHHHPQHYHQPSPIPNVSEHRAMCAFILSVCCRSYPPGRAACLHQGVFDSCLVHIRDPDPLLRQWSALCIAMMWDEDADVKALGVKRRVHELFCEVVRSDEVAEVRAAVLYALGTLLGTTGSSSDEKKFGSSVVCEDGAKTGLSLREAMDLELGVAMATLGCSTDGSPAVRRELIVLLSAIVNEHRGQFVVAAYRAILERVVASSTSVASAAGGAGRVTEGTLSSISSALLDIGESDDGVSDPAFQLTLFACMYKTISDLTTDPFPDIALLASGVMDYILELLFASSLGPPVRSLLHGAPDAASAPSFSAPPSPAVPVVDSNSSSTTVRSRPVGPTRSATLAASALKTFTSLTAGATSSSSTLTSPFDDAQSPLVPPSSLRLNGKSLGSVSPKAGSSGTQSPIQSSASTDSLRYLQSKAGRPPTKRRQSAPIVYDQASMDELVEALVNSDEERLRRKRANEECIGMGKQVLPLKGTFYDFGLEYYKESQMRPTEADEPGSIAHNRRVWRRARNEAAIMKTQPMKGPACRASWDEQIGFYASEALPTKILFHQFERHLLAADGKGNINVYDWENNLRVNRFTNGTLPSVPISSIRFVNEDDVAVLMTGSSDGHVRLFRNYESPRHVQLVSAFQGISEGLETNTKAADSGLVLEWQQGRGQLLMGGNVKYIRVWDATRENLVQDIPTRANSCLTSLTCDQVAGNILVAGFGDGTVKVYDRRLSSRDSMVRNYKGDHRSWIVNLHMQRGGNRELLSGSLDGEVCLWDIRLTEPLQTIQSHQGGMAQMAVHEHAPIFATSSTQNVIKVWSMNDEVPAPVSKFRNAAGYVSAKPGPMTAMAFHPHHMILGCASADGAINVFEMEDYKGALAKVQTSLSPLGIASRMAAYSNLY